MIVFTPRLNNCNEALLTASHTGCEGEPQYTGTQILEEGIYNVPW